jgi:hypothetical protein
MLTEHSIAFSKGEAPQGPRLEGLAIADEASPFGEDAVTGHAQDPSQYGIGFTFDHDYVPHHRGCCVENEQDIPLKGIGGHGVASDLGETDHEEPHDHQKYRQTDDPQGPSPSTSGAGRIANDQTIRHRTQSNSAGGA